MTLRQYSNSVQNENICKLPISEQEYIENIEKIDKDIYQAQMNDNKQIILKLMKEKNQFIQLYRIKLDQKKNPRLDCNNELCYLENKEIGLLDIITGDCYNALILDRLSDGYCYKNQQGIGINKLMTDSKMPIRNAIGLTYNLNDYIEILGGVDGSKKYYYITANKLEKDIDTSNISLQLEYNEEEPNMVTISNLQHDLDKSLLVYWDVLNNCFSQLMESIETFKESQLDEYIITTNKIDGYNALQTIIKQLVISNKNEIINELFGDYPSYEMLDEINYDFLWEIDTIIMNRFRESHRDIYSPR